MKQFDICIIAGSPGTGKTTAGQRLTGAFHAELCDADLIRRDLGITEYSPSDRPRVNAEIESRVRKALDESRTAIVCVVFGDRKIRLRTYELLGSMSQQVRRKLNVLLIQCECSRDIARLRILGRPDKGNLPTVSNDPAVYDQREAERDPVQSDEIDDNPDISFVTYDTESNLIAEIAVRAAHLETLTEIRKVLEGEYFGRRDPTWELQRLEAQAVLAGKSEFPVWDRLGLNRETMKDWGCGPGHYAKALAAHFENVVIHGVDLNGPWIRYVNDRYGGSSRLSFADEDIRRGSKEQFDINYSRFVMQHLTHEERGAVVRNMVDATVPGGLVVLIDYDVGSFSLDPPCREFEAMKAASAKAFEDRGRDKGVGSKLKTYLVAAGLKDVTEYDSSLAIRGDDLAAYRDMVIPAYKQRYGDSEEIRVLEKWFADGIRSGTHTVTEGVIICAGRKGGA